MDAVNLSSSAVSHTPNPTPHTLLLHRGALGDFVVTFPLLASLQGHTTVVTHASKAKLAARLFAHVRGADIETFRWPSEFAGHVISFIGDVERKSLVVNPRPPADWTKHVTAWHRQELARQGWVMRMAPLNPKRLAKRGVVVIHTGSGGRDKCWPADRFDKLISRLRIDRSVRVIAGEAEVDRGIAGGAEVLLTLDALHDVLADASLYIGNDAGPTHLAAWLGVPTLALFGPSLPTVWSPIGPAVTVLAPPTPRPMTWLDVDTVLAAANSRRYDDEL